MFFKWFHSIKRSRLLALRENCDPIIQAIDGLVVIINFWWRMGNILFTTHISIWLRIDVHSIGDMWENFRYIIETAITAFTDEKNWALSIYMRHNHQDKVET